VKKRIGVYPGQYYDQETGLHYNYHRYYDPSTGRYLTPDPIGLAGGINLFLYANNDPINLIDLLGLKLSNTQKLIVSIVSSGSATIAYALTAASGVGTALAPEAGAATGAFVGGVLSLALGGDRNDFLISIYSGAASGYIGGIVGNALLGTSWRLALYGGAAIDIGTDLLLLGGTPVLKSPCEE
jgi:RHS repeat-associated protein